MKELQPPPRDPWRYTPMPIYGRDADDPTARSPAHRADQLFYMCKILIRAADSPMNVDLAEILPGQLEVMAQLADELRQHLDP